MGTAADNVALANVAAAALLLTISAIEAKSNRLNKTSFRPIVY